ncbi:MAG: NHL repeat-containing protein [Bacteroidota bacterium]
MTRLASFQDAVSLSADPAGRLYVVDAAAATVTVLDAGGEVLATHGGPGSGDYGFFEPADLDPTNGLAFFVADLGNQRVQRFERDFRLVRSIPVELPGDEGPRDGADRAVPGDPVAVALSPTGDLHVLDARSRTVLTLDPDRSFERTLGAFRLPVDLTVGDDGTLYVADRGRQRLVVFDTYGFRLRTIDLPAPPQAVAIVRGHLLVTFEADVALISTEGVTLASARATAEDRLVGAAWVQDDLLLLTKSDLYRLPRGLHADG